MKRILVIHTGGTLGMIEGHPSNQLKPSLLNESVAKFVPELKEIANLESAYVYNIDSANLTISHINMLITAIEDNYTKFDGFVIIHGTDTMAYCASAISFLIKNLSKPVVFTGSQKPLRHIRNDARLNLINSVEFATMDIPEVTICFDSKLFRGNRTKKISVDHFDAFSSPNYPCLAEVGVNVELNKKYLFKIRRRKTEFYRLKEKNICSLKLFPGFRVDPYLKMFENTPPEGVIIEAYAAGNFPILEDSFIPLIDMLENKTIPVFVVSQCINGKVDMELYECGQMAMEAGAVGCRDMTFEATMAKLMYTLSNYETLPVDEIKAKMQRNIRGEIS